MLLRIRECGTTQEQKKAEKAPESRQAISPSELGGVDWDAINREVEAYRREQQLLRDAPFPVTDLGDYPWMQWEIDGRK